MRARSAAILFCALAWSGAAWATLSQGPSPAARHWHAGEYLAVIVPLGDGQCAFAPLPARATITNPLASVGGGTVATASGFSAADRQAATLISLMAALSVFSSSALGLAELGRRKPA